MRIVSIEPTPSPNSMKINLDIRLPDGERRTYDRNHTKQAPDYIVRLLEIPGVSGVFHTADFLAVDREPKADWQTILHAVRQTFGGDGEPQAGGAAATEGEANVYVQKFRGIPLQIRVKSGDNEERAAMPPRFIEAAMQAQYGSPNLIKERVLEDYGVRYGERKEIAEQVLSELDASYDTQRLNKLIEDALSSSPDPEASMPAAAEEKRNIEEIAAGLDNPDWKIRYAALDKLKPEQGNLPLIEKALDDANFSIRRLATVYLGDIKGPEAMRLLYRMLRDPSASVRRTAGDCLSDIGDPDAIAPMCEALRDASRIVRWRAARFLYEAGDESALPALKEAANDAEFEVRMQVQVAIARIEGGEAAAGSVWQQITRRERQ